MRKMMFVLPLVALLALVAGCAKPPQADIDAANQALESARAAGASDYAPDSLRAAEDAKAALESELRAQEQKFALFRSYKKATELATSAKEAAERASADAAEGKQRARREAEALIAEAKTARDEASTMLEKAPRGKGTAADLEALKADLSGVDTSIADAEAAFSAERYLEAKSKAEAAKSSAANVKTAIEQAMEAKRAARR